MTLHTRICEMFHIEVPIFLAGMSGVAYAEVCAAVSEAGGFGTLGMATCSPRRIREQIQEVRKRTQKPFGVDLLTALPDQMNAAVEIMLEEKVDAFISGLGVPVDVVKRCHDAGIKVINMCGTVRHALLAEQAGCDVVVAQGTEAGGHTGNVAALALIPQVVDAVKIPVLAAGAIVDGRGLAASLALGAEGVWMGTRFIASEEGHGAALYKDAILSARDEDTVISRSYSGKPMRVRRNAWTSDWEKRPGDIQKFPQQAALSFQAGVTGTLAGQTENLDPERACFAMGQGAGAIDEILPAAEIVRRTVEEARIVIERLGKLR